LIVNIRHGSGLAGNRLDDEEKIPTM